MPDSRNDHPLRNGNATVTSRVNNVLRYTEFVIHSFRDADSERVWKRERSRKIDKQTSRIVLRKLLVLDAANELNDLRIPPGNRLEKLRGDRIGQYSIRVNQQWRICFVWTKAGPTNVEITDYH